MMKELEYSIRELDRNQTESIYTQWIRVHFPEDEVKPLKHILRMWDDGKYQTYGMFDENTLMAYAFFAQVPGNKQILLDYLAVIEDYRGLGTGSIFLKEMKQLKPLSDSYQGVLIETEDVDCAADEEERAVRVKRNAFYTRAGASLSGLVTSVYDVQYTIWNYPLTEEKKIDREACRENLQEIYKMMVPGEKYEKHVRI